MTAYSLSISGSDFAEDEVRATGLLGCFHSQMKKAEINTGIKWVRVISVSMFALL